MKLLLFNILYEQPLHCGYASDRGGNDINVHWYRRKQNLHHVGQVLIFFNHTTISSVSAIIYYLYTIYRFGTLALLRQKLKDSMTILTI